MRIGHISDLHVLDLEGVKPWSFANKRALGGINLLMHRGDRHSVDVLRKALTRLQDCEIDHLCVTGDLTNLSLPSEFRAARDLLADYFDPEDVSVVPGNHDCYTPGAVRERRFETFLADYLHSDLPAYQQESGYPYCKIRGDVAIIGLSSGIASPPLYATGRVGDAELRATEALLQDPMVRERFAITMIHHHVQPFPHSRLEYLRRLTNADEVLSVLRRGEVDLMIHGHNHHWSIEEIPHLSGTGTLRICEAGSTSTAYYSEPEFGGKFNIYDIEGTELVRIETHLFEADDSDFVHWNEQVFTQTVDGA